MLSSGRIVFSGFSAGNYVIYPLDQPTALPGAAAGTARVGL